MASSLKFPSGTLRPVLLFFTLAAGLSANALAQQSSASTAPDTGDTGGFRGYLIGGALSVPEYEGSSEQTVVPLIAAQIRWDDYRYVAWDGIGGRANILNAPDFEFGPVVNVTLGRQDDVESLRVRRLGEIDTAFELGAFAAYSARGVMNDRDQFRLSAQVTSDVSDTHEGVLGEISANYSTQATDRLRLSAVTSLSYVDDAYAETYFGITPAASRASGLAVTDVEGGVKDVSVGFTAAYDLNSRWSLFALSRYSRLLGDIADSPIVALEGDDNQWSAGIGLGWAF